MYFTSIDINVSYKIPTICTTHIMSNFLVKYVIIYVIKVDCGLKIAAEWPTLTGIKKSIVKSYIRKGINLLF